MEQFYTTHVISAFCNVYPTTVINWINEGILPAFATPGGHRRVKRSDLIDFLRRYNMPLSEELLKENKTRILVIDDDAKILRMIKTILEAEDIEVVTAKDGFKAGVMVSELAPDIILLDILMPKIDGFEVARRIRQNEKTKKTPIIAVTVLRNEKEIKKMFASGITDYLAKPFKSKELIEKIKRFLPAWQKESIGKTS